MGELCRFIVNQPENPSLEKNHTLRTMFGVGVKPEVWEAFASRFNVSKFVEAYGSTEGNCTLGKGWHFIILEKMFKLVICV